ncbi:hypothetical protein RRG08_034036 [Elysia crispata]|uniref:Uncharacterized protein n=1 Tax=Elysia crispata TaxID=231223 RepID=A0AAE0YKE0_9GAST|nr:hypothetical protein RRG08_034036 [Elysia crispata]
MKDGEITVIFTGDSHRVVAEAVPPLDFYISLGGESFAVLLSPTLSSLCFVDTPNHGPAGCCRVWLGDLCGRLPQRPSLVSGVVSSPYLISSDFLTANHIQFLTIPSSLYIHTYKHTIRPGFI